MSKSCNTLELALATVAKYSREGRDTEHRIVGDKYIIFDKETNKILKSIDYKPADMSKFI